MEDIFAGVVICITVLAVYLTMRPVHKESQSDNLDGYPTNSTELDSVESFESKPSPDQVEQFASEVERHKHLFDRGLYEARSAMPWIDAITYEDIRKLKINGDLNKENVSRILV